MRKYRFVALLLAVVLAVSLLSTAAAAHERPTRYDIDVEVEGKGTAWTSPTRAYAGDTVSISVRPGTGYYLKDITVVADDYNWDWEDDWELDDSWFFEPSHWFDGGTSAGSRWDGWEVSVNRWKEFTMPRSDVTFYVTFAIDTCGAGWTDCPSYRYTDVGSYAWYHEAVDYAIDSGYMEGVSKTRFAPNDAVTRAMTWMVLGRVSGRWNLEGGSPWYADAQTWAKNNGISDGKNPTAVVTREELATMLYRWYGSPRVYGDLDDYLDRGEVSSWAEKAMIWAIDSGLMDGMGRRTLSPQSPTTRAQLAVILLRLNNL